MRFVGATPPDAAASILARAAALDAAVAGPAAAALPDFQAAAAARAIAAMDRWGGAIVADAVGMGKTHVALAVLADHLRAARTDAALVTPAALRAHWGPRLRTSLRDAGARVWRIPGPQPATDAPCVLWLSHSHLSRNGAIEPGPSLVVVDEAHAFRNPATRRYRALAGTCAAARVLLLTATPINNSLLDLHAQIRLFAGDGAFAALGVPSLAAAFRAAAAGDWPRGLDDVIAAVVIRRDRTAIQRAAIDRTASTSPALTYPRRLPPRPVVYRPDPDVVPALLRQIETLDLHTLGLGVEPGRAGAAELVRLLLLKRLESSPAALRATVFRLLAFHRAFLDELAGGGLLLPRDHRAAGAGVQLSLAGLLSRPLPRGFDTGAARRRAQSAVAGLIAMLQSANIDADPKADALDDVLGSELGGRRVLIFTEYRETADHLWRRLRGRYRVALVHGAGAWLGADRCPREAALAQFAPGARVPAMLRADVLIATDVLAEGLDLQAADCVISYDLPWNPVRLIQRIGRIDRLGSPHACVVSYTFLPDRGLDAMLGLIRRLRAKLAAIHRGIGPEPPILGADADADRLGDVLRRIRARDDRLLEDLERGPTPDQGLADLLAHAPADPLPADVVPVAVCPAAARMLVALVANGVVRWLCDPPATSGAAAAALIRAAHHAPRNTPAPRLVRGLAARARTIAEDRIDTPRPVDGVRGRAARRLLAALGAVPGGPTPTLLARAERLLDRLARDGNAAVDSRLRTLMRGPPADCERTCAGLEASFRGVQAPPSDPRVQILGVIAAGPAPHARTRAPWDVPGALDT